MASSASLVVSGCDVLVLVMSWAPVPLTRIVTDPSLRDLRPTRLNLRAESRAAMCSNNGRQCAAYSTPRCARMAYRRSVGGAQARYVHTR
jgi:hypothetical protein